MLQVSFLTVSWICLWMRQCVVFLCCYVMFLTTIAMVTWFFEVLTFLLDFSKKKITFISHLQVFKMCIAWKFSIIRACKEHLYRKFDDNLVSTAKNTLLEPPHQGHSNDVFLWSKISSNSLVFSLSKFSLLQLFCICTIYFLNRVTLIICMLRAKKQKQNSTHNFGISRLKDKFFKQIWFICDKTRFLLNRAGQAKLQIWAFFAIIIYPYYNQKVKPILYQHTCISRMFSQNSNNHRTKEMVCINVSKCFVFLRRIVIVVWSILNNVQFCAVVIVLLRSCVLSVCVCPAGMVRHVGVGDCLCWRYWWWYWFLLFVGSIKEIDFMVLKTAPHIAILTWKPVKLPDMRHLISYTLNYKEA